MGGGGGGTHRCIRMEGIFVDHGKEWCTAYEVYVGDSRSIVVDIQHLHCHHSHVSERHFTIVISLQKK